MFEKVLEFSVLAKSKISVLFLLPFWYLAIYLFNIELFNSSDLVLKIVICFCISLPAESIFSFYFYKLMISNQEDKGEEIDDSYLVDSSVFILLLWLSFLILVAYTSKKYLWFYIPFDYLILWFYVLPFLVFALLQMVKLSKLIKKKE